ncbi:hypothetical protein GCM10017567_15690 [Amycolatopsis bullii]|uniref:Uncharacterized protein n=2 Tax=Pseudonocardiaceae TaxID=2070 RepID=A0ABQ3K2P0_9PSEU|nr:hypothetical protein GCM10017567_15690 [Amycolatopsis bullii]
MSEAAVPDDDFDYLADLTPVVGFSDDDNSPKLEVADPPPEIVWPASGDVEEGREGPRMVAPRPAASGSRPTAPRPVLQPSASEADVRIGLWGAPRAGKTTYLSALRIAAQKPVMGYRWSLSGCDTASADFLNESVKRFVRDKDFPAPTRGYRTLSWRFEGTRHHPENGRFAKLRKKLSVGSPQEVDIEFIVQMQDAAGETFGEGEAAKHYDGVRSHLMNADGIVYVFDPIGNEEKATKSFDFYFETLERLKTGMREQGLLVGGKLPHFLSVCVTKFDHPAIFNAAMKAGIIYQEHEGAMPVVPSSIAPEFLRGLCRDEGSRWVCDTLESEFLPERVSYFATSAVGFHLSDGKFNLRNFSNVAPDGQHFLGAAMPINVLEPIISLHRRVRGQAGLA